MRLIKSVLKNTLGGAGLLVNATGNLLLQADGSATAPAITFASEPTLGLYRSAPGTISVAGGMLAVVPVGFIGDFGMASAPSGWLACDGQAVSRTAYAALFSAIGTTWGAGDGSTTFNVPNLINRYRRHRDGSTVAGSVGNLQAADTAPHTHAVNGNTSNETAAHSHFYSGTTGAMTANATHTHGPGGSGVSAWREYGGFQSITSGGAIIGIQVNNGTDGSFALTDTNTDHGHPYSGNTGTESANHAHVINLTSTSYGGTETRPLSATLLTCIKAT
ncbi:phage tail protein [Bradyrhizobium sp. B120]|uniref:phage tail protein n=1 Tax=Bradyrhizobium sp. B120 TaxID=3410088 RepID=UPI003B98381E